MTPKLENKIYKKFPKLYRQAKLSEMQTCMCWGFQCGDGWYQLLYNLSQKISDHVELNHDEFAEYYPEVSQVKSKYGMLRFNVDGADDEIHKMIDKAEKLADITCEDCGKEYDGKMKNYGSWVYNMCDECFDKFNKQREEDYLKFKEDTKWMKSKESK